MNFRYNDENKEFSKEELERQNYIDNSIMNLINMVNPTKLEILYDRNIVAKVRYALIEIFSKDLQICTDSALYP
jgi:hypothetical protein